MISYRAFHAVWTLPLLAACGACFIGVQAPIIGLLVVSAVSCVVVVFTFPWDNWAVARKVWDFPDGQVWFRIQHLPVEEVFFFVVQTFHVGLLVCAWLAFFGPYPNTDADFSPVSTALLGILGAAWILLWFVAKKWLRSRRTSTYAVHLAYWFAPILIAQWIFAWPILAPRLDALLIPAAIVGTILTMADVWAIRRGIWFFDETQVSGIRVGAILPIEEMCFFYITSVLVAQSVIILLPAGAR